MYFILKYIQMSQRLIHIDLLFQQIVFEGVRGNSYQGDIAIDDIKLTNGICPQGQIQYMLLCT